MAKIIIEVRGGIVQEVYTDCNAEIILVDWDNIEGSDCDGKGAEYLSGLGLKRMPDETAKEVDLLES